MGYRNWIFNGVDRRMISVLVDALNEAAGRKINVGMGHR